MNLNKHFFGFKFQQFTKGVFRESVLRKKKNPDPIGEAWHAETSTDRLRLRLSEHSPHHSRHAPDNSRLIEVTLKSQESITLLGNFRLVQCVLHRVVLAEMQLFTRILAFYSLSVCWLLDPKVGTRFRSKDSFSTFILGTPEASSSTRFDLLLKAFASSLSQLTGYLNNFDRLLMCSPALSRLN